MKTHNAARKDLDPSPGPVSLPSPQEVSTASLPLRLAGLGHYLAVFFYRVPSVHVTRKE